MREFLDLGKISPFIGEHFTQFEGSFRLGEHFIQFEGSSRLGEDFIQFEGNFDFLLGKLYLPHQFEALQVKLLGLVWLSTVHF